MDHIPFSQLSSTVINDLARGNSVAITGLSNTGKSTFLRALAESDAAKKYKELAKKDGSLIYIDCNHAVALSAQAFYEVVLRSLLERLRDEIKPALLNSLQDYHEAVTDATTAFAASLSFNHALSDLCGGLDRNLCLLLDEFDEIYVALDDRALLNLRALRDRFSRQLTFATGTIRRLPELRGQAFEGEFAEIFSRHTYHMPLLTQEEIEGVLTERQWKTIDASFYAFCHEQSGGHPGLLIALLQMLSGLEAGAEIDLSRLFILNPQIGAECLKLWSQLEAMEQEWLTSLVLEAEAGLPRQHIARLENLGLIRDGEIFSPIFAEFVGRRSRSADVVAQGVFVDSDSGDVWVDGVRVSVLTDLEFRLLELLFERRDKITDKYRIVTQVWGEDYLGEVDDSRVEKLVSRLRSKIEPDPSNPCYLITQRGRGYKLLSMPALND